MVAQPQPLIDRGLHYRHYRHYRHDRQYRHHIHYRHHRHHRHHGHHIHHILHIHHITSHTLHYITLHYITLHYMCSALHYIPYHTTPYHTIPHHTIPYHNIYIYIYVCIYISYVLLCAGAGVCVCVNTTRQSPVDRCPKDYIIWDTLFLHGHFDGGNVFCVLDVGKSQESIGCQIVCENRDFLKWGNPKAIRVVADYLIGKPWEAMWFWGFRPPVSSNTQMADVS